jgi:hypothetical protein
MLVLHENRQIPGVLFMRMSGKPTDEEIDIYIADQRRNVATYRGQKVVVVMELKEVWSSKHRKQIRDFEAEMEIARKTKPLGLAVVVPNGLIRGAFTAFFWIAAPSYPTKMVPRSADAWEWVSQILVSADLHPPTRADFERVATGPWPARHAVPGRGMIALESGANRSSV